MRAIVYKQWKLSRSQNQANVEDIAVAWSTYQNSTQELKKAIKTAKRRLWKKFCNDMHNLKSDKTYPILKRIKKKHSTIHKFSHSDGPQAAAEAMATHLRSVFGGDQENLSS